MHRDRRPPCIDTCTIANLRRQEQGRQQSVTPVRLTIQQYVSAVESVPPDPPVRVSQIACCLLLVLSAGASYPAPSHP